VKVVIYNDTSRAFGKIHFGCELVMASLHDLLNGAGFEIIGSVSLDDARENRISNNLLKQADLVIANGEGSYHHNRRPDFVKVAKRYPTALINTVYQQNNDDLRCFKYISARESKSRNEIARQAPCDLVPDVIFTSKYLASVKPSNGGGAVSVQHYANGREFTTLQDAKHVVPAIAIADKVKTESFHAGCVAAYYGKPLMLSKSNTHKMEGLAADLGIEMGKPGMPDTDYVGVAQQRIMNMIDKLANL